MYNGFFIISIGTKKHNSLQRRQVIYKFHKIKISLIGREIPERDRKTANNGNLNDLFRTYILCLIIRLHISVLSYSREFLILLTECHIQLYLLIGPLPIILLPNPSLK